MGPEVLMETAFLTWLVFGIINFGSEFAYRQGHCPECADTQINSDRLQSFFMSLGGPMITFILLVSGELFQHGWRLR